MVKTARFQYSRKCRIIKKAISQTKIELNLKESGIKVLFTYLSPLFLAPKIARVRKKLKIQSCYIW